MKWKLKAGVAAALGENAESVLVAVNALTQEHKRTANVTNATLALQRELCELAEAPEDPEEPL